MVELRCFFFFSSRRRHTRCSRDWSSDVCSSDLGGKKYLDLTAAFGVAAAGHANPRVVKAGQRQMSKLLHAMGDVHPHALKAHLARELSRITFERWTVAADVRRRNPGRKGSVRLLSSAATGKTIFCNSGFEAVEAALKTAMLATGKRGIIAFEGAYHGLGYGALNATHRQHFRGPFRSQLGEFGFFVPFPESGALKKGSDGVMEKTRATPPLHHSTTPLKQVENAIRKLYGQVPIGAILV